MGPYTVWVDECPCMLRTVFGALFRDHSIQIIDIRDHFVIPCLGDLLVYSATFGNHLQHLGKVLE